MAALTEGIVERHFLRCPHCHGYQDLERRVCGTCGAKPVAILWTDPQTPVSPELVLVGRRR